MITPSRSRPATQNQLETRSIRYYRALRRCVHSDSLLIICDVLIGIAAGGTLALWIYVIVLYLGGKGA